jgi:hypothetical protein
MPRNNKRWPLELDAGLRESVEQVLKARKKNEPAMNRNELLAQLIRRGLSDEAKAPVVHLRCADPLTMAELRGDVDKMEKHFVRVRSAILHRNRCVDKDDPESVERFKDDDRQTREFLTECKKLLVVAADHAWDLRGFPADDVAYLRQVSLPDWGKRLEAARAEATKIEAEIGTSSPSEDSAARLKKARNNSRMYSALIGLVKFALFEDANAG